MPAAIRRLRGERYKTTERYMHIQSRTESSMTLLLCPHSLERGGLHNTRERCEVHNERTESAVSMFQCYRCMCA